MQNKHQIFFLVLGVPTLGEGGGVDLVGPNSQIFPKIRFEGSPKRKEETVKKLGQEFEFLRSKRTKRNETFQMTVSLYFMAN